MSYLINERLLTVNPKTRPGRKLTAVKGVIIHWTANTGKGADADAHYRYFNKGTVFASAHYFVDDKQILRIIPENEMAYHVGAKTYKTKKYGAYPNETTIGIEICVNADGNFLEAYKRAIWLTADILKRHGLGLSNLDRHFDITGKACPLFFTSDTAAKTYLGQTAAAAYTSYRTAVFNTLTTKTTPSVTPVVTTTGPIGIATVLVESLNVRTGPSFTYPLYQENGQKKSLKKGSTWKVYEKKSGLYRVGKDQWISAGTDYVRFSVTTTVERKTYTVVAGDSLWKIATKQKTTVKQIKQLNNLESDTISVGQVLKLD